eukprot:5500300-Prymnesium_polylepis.1
MCPRSPAAEQLRQWHGMPQNTDPEHIAPRRTSPECTATVAPQDARAQLELAPGGQKWQGCTGSSGAGSNGTSTLSAGSSPSVSTWCQKKGGV